MTAATVVRHYFTAQTFLTRLPAPKWVGYEPDWVPPSLAWFPVVGVVIGVLSGLALWAAAAVTTAPVAAVVAVLVSALLTGALHEDALADTADGIGGGRDAAHALEIMRDSRVGSYGVLSLIIACLLRVALLSALNPTAAFVALVLAHSLSRASVFPLMTALPYLRDSGAGAPFVGDQSRQNTLVFAAWLLVIIGLFSGLLAALVSAALSALAYGFFSRRLGGITGDGFGAVIVVVECAVLAVQVVLA